MTIYFLSGLGADERVFQRLVIPGHHKIYLSWLTPNKSELLSEYAKRMSEKINTKEPFVLIGLSFGGMLAIEMMEFVKPAKTFLISSAASINELPFYYRWAGKLKMDKLLPEKKMSQSNAFLYWCFGVQTKNEQVILKEILSATDAKFTKWAIHAIINWNRTQAPENVIRIHGTNDRVLPMQRAVNLHKIYGGGHLMILNKADAVSSILQYELNKLQ